jgi:Fe-S cluster biogenesis protein NfuA
MDPPKQPTPMGFKGKRSHRFTRNVKTGTQQKNSATLRRYSESASETVDPTPLIVAGQTTTSNSCVASRKTTKKDVQEALKIATEEATRVREESEAATGKCKSKQQSTKEEGVQR